MQEYVREKKKGAIIDNFSIKTFRDRIYLYVFEAMPTGHVVHLTKAIRAERRGRHE